MAADEIDYELEGDDFQAVVITLDPDEGVHAEPGAMLYKEKGVDLETTTGGGVLSGLKRKISGETFFVSTFVNEAKERRRIAFAGDFPGKILPIDLSRGTIHCQKSAYLCSARGVNVSISFTKKLGAGFFGGEGFILQKLTGDGLAFIHAGGHIIERQLAEDEEIYVDTGCLVGFDDSIDYDIKFIRGVKTLLFGGEGLFHARLTGPGRVWLQTTPLSRFADRILMAGRSSKGEVSRGGMVSGS